MSLLATLQKLAYEPLSTEAQALINSCNNEIIRERLVKELSQENICISYGVFACETAVFS